MSLDEVKSRFVQLRGRDDPLSDVSSRQTSLRRSKLSSHLTAGGKTIVRGICSSCSFRGKCQQRSFYLAFVPPRSSSVLLPASNHVLSDESEDPASTERVNAVWRRKEQRTESFPCETICSIISIIFRGFHIENFPSISIYNPLSQIDVAF